MNCGSKFFKRMEWVSAIFLSPVVFALVPSKIGQASQNINFENEGEIQTANLRKGNQNSLSLVGSGKQNMSLGQVNSSKTLNHVREMREHFSEGNLKTICAVSTAPNRQPLLPGRPWTAQRILCMETFCSCV